MQLAFCLYKYFPFGGLQRDFMRIALACQARGHAIRVYTLEWNGEMPTGFEIVSVPYSVWSGLSRYSPLTWAALPRSPRVSSAPSTDRL